MSSNIPQSVLVIDDENMMGEMLARYLKREGFVSHTAANSEEGLSVLRREKIDVVLLDIKLGDEDGFDVLKLIKKEHPTLPVVMLTGLGYDEKAMKEALDLGASGYLSKSADITEVGITVRRVLPATS
jgi:DNA-binding response OmpR family regulator